MKELRKWIRKSLVWVLDNSECEIFIKQTSSGLVISHKVTGGKDCGSRFNLSVKQAMELTKRLPKPKVQAIFNSEIEVTFKASEN